MLGVPLPEAEDWPTKTSLKNCIKVRMQLETEDPCLLVLFLHTFNLNPSDGFFSKALRLAPRLSMIFSMSLENFSVITVTTKDFWQMTTGGA